MDALDQVVVVGMTERVPSPFVVATALSKVYYRGLPSCPPLVATTKLGPFEGPTGPEAYTVLKELRALGDHPLASVWDHGLADRLRHALNTVGVNWTSVDALRIVDVGSGCGESSDSESRSPAIVWIGVEPGALSFEEGSAVALGCRTLIDSYGVPDCHVEIRESRVVRQAAGPASGGGARNRKRSRFRFLDPVPLSDPTFTARDPYTATLGIPISTRNRPWLEGTGGFYFSAGGEDRNVYLVTARHVVFPVHECDNEEYTREANAGSGGNAREDVVVLGIPGFNNKLAAIDKEIKAQGSAVVDAQERVGLVKDAEDPQSARERKDAERELEKAEGALQELRAFRQDVAARWSAKERRVFGELVWAPPITLSTEPGQYTLDLAVIKVRLGALDAGNYRGNAVNIGKKLSRYEFMEKVSLHPTSPGPAKSFKYPADRLVRLEGQVSEIDLAVKPSMLDRNGDPCLVVFKNGVTSSTTVGRANNVPSYTRTYLAGRYQESREWAVLPEPNDNLHPKFKDGFSKAGDSGSCVADVFGRIVGVLTGGCTFHVRGTRERESQCFDVTYVTPVSCIMKALHNTQRFASAHLDPTLS